MDCFDLNDVVLAPCEGFNSSIQGDIMEIDKSKEIAYVRFRNQNHRLDAWVKFSDMQMVTKHADGGATPKKRNKQEDGSYFSNPIRNVDIIQYGPYKINCWYYSPYSQSLTTNRELYICDSCLSYFPDKESFEMHGHKQEKQRPPGKEIYRYDNLSLFEVSGQKHKFFCQCLSLLAKLFLDDVAVFYNVAPFVFYVLCECDSEGAHVVSFFSRDINWRDNNILACILVFPPFQRRGYGSLMISIAYEMARRIGIVGGPEKPLSDLGTLAFKAYWKEIIIATLFKYIDKIKCLDDLVILTSIAKPDLIKSLKEMNLLFHTIEGWTSTLNIEAIKDRVENGQKPHQPKVEFHNNYLSWLPDTEEETKDEITKETKQKMLTKEEEDDDDEKEE